MQKTLFLSSMNNWKRLTETDLSSSSCGRRQHTAVELSVEASKQTTDAPHTDSHRAETTREVELEIWCKKQHEDIEQLHEQLLKMKINLEAEVAKPENKNTVLCEFKTKLCTSEALCQIGFGGAKLKTRTGKDWSFLPGNRREEKPGEHKHQKQTPANRRREDCTAAESNLCKRQTR